MVASTNNQPSQAGQGFELATSYVERKYAACVDDGHAGKGDLCWKSDNATLVLDGRATELVKDADTGVWRLKDDDGSRIQRLTNTNANGDSDREYWKLTTTDGTQYFFGLHVLPGWVSGEPGTSSVFYVPVAGDDSGEPCYDSAGFGSSFCNQAWRWSLDYVVDPNENAMSLWYSRETNYYAKNGDTSPGAGAYVRGGSLARIEYGQRANTVYSVSAPAQVVFTPKLRCIPDSAGACPTGQSAWPDVPVDQICLSTQACTGKLAPTFFSRNRLATITTQVLKSGAYSDIDSWTLTHTFPTPGDNTSAALWLANIAHTGKGGAAGTDIALPAVTFGGTTYTNRVDAIEGNAPMEKWRVHKITSETGGTLDVTYRNAECTRAALPAPDTNAKACFPSYWTRPGEFEPRIDWFHKYLVAEVSQIDDVAASSRVTTFYAYHGGGAWRYNSDELTPAKHRTWSDWRGYASVTSTIGDAGGTRSQSTALYFRGMNGDRNASGGTKPPVAVIDSEGGEVTDSDHFAGFVRERRTFNGPGGAEVSGEIALPWAVQTASGGGKTAWMLNTRSAKTRTTLDGGRAARRTTVINEYTGDGLLEYVDDRGDDATSADDRCSRTTYAQNRTDWMLAYPSRVETVSAACTVTPARPGDVVSDVRTAYDNGAVGATPTRGNPSTEQRVASYSGTTPVYQTVSSTEYDAHGRPTAVTNAEDKTTRTSITPTTGGPVTKTVVTNPLGHTQTTDLDPAWGVPTKQTDTNGKLTELAYDALGRITAVWLPTRVRANSENPNLTFSYRVSKTTASAVSTSTIRDDGETYNTTWEIYDGWLRPRQTQKSAPGGGRVVNETLYDSRGLASKVRADFFNASAPSYGLVTTTDAATPAITAYTYDGAGRVTNEAFSTAPVAGDIRVDRWQTTTRYGGDRTYVDPPGGGPGLTEITDARGNVIERREHPSGAPSGTATATSYSYDAADRLRKITDADGNEWTYTFDLRGRQTETVDPDAGHTTKTFDDLDRLATTTDARDRTLAYDYDDLGRKTALFQGALTGTKLAEWTYDTVPNAVGQPVTSIRYVNGNAYTKGVLEYDRLYRPTRSQVVIPAVEGDLAGDYRSSAAYSLDGSLLQTYEPAAGGLPGELHAYTDNELGMPDTMEGISTYVTDTVYNKLGDPEIYRLQATPDRYASTHMQYESGTRRLTRSYTSTATNTEGPRHLDRHYTYNDIGDITSVKEDAGTVEIECYKRDGYRRLTDVWTLGSGTCGTPTLGTGPAPYWTSWTYTTTGLRETQTAHLSSGNVTSTYSYPAAGGVRPHAVSSITNSSSGATKAFDYDDSGNTTSRVNHLTNATQTLTWDDEGRLASITEGGKSTSNIYDADGELLLRKDVTETVLFLGDTEAHLSSSGTLSGVRHYSHNGQTIAVRTTNGTGGTKLTWLAVDHHNTALAAVDVMTHTASRRRENPFGVLRTDPAGWPSTRSFVGGFGDNTTGTGLVHLGARDYDPAIGRFLSVDPVLAPTDPQSLTAYGYGNNNPISMSDPSGLRPTEEYDSCGGCSPSTPSDTQVATCAAGGSQGCQTVLIQRIIKKGRNLNVDWREAKIRYSYGRAGQNKFWLAFGLWHDLDPDYAERRYLGTSQELFHKRYADSLTNAEKVEHYKQVSLALLYILTPVGDANDCAHGDGISCAGIAMIGPLRALDIGVDATRAARKACSFSGDTHVLMADGSTKPISEVQVGDQVLATDPETGEQGPREVTATWAHQDQLVDLKLKDQDGVTVTVTTTEDHRYRNSSDKAWHQAQHLDPGDTLRTANGRTITVTGIDWTTQHQGAAYNLTIAELHTYHITVNAILVHNDCLPSPTEAADRIREATPVGSALKADSWHRSASFVVDNVATDGTVFEITGYDGVRRTLVQMPGEMNGITGRFEWILEGDKLTHQMFVRGGSINGVPIKK